ncbi:ulp1 protease family, C-terminal catalytic domain-containing protein [Tanacetum coccineum]
MKLCTRNLFVEYESRLGYAQKNKGKRLEVFIEEKDKEDKADKEVPDIKKGRSTSTSISIEGIADHTGAKKNFFGKKTDVEPHPISIDEYNDSKFDSEYTRIIKKTKVKRTTVEEESVASKRKNMEKTMTDVKNKNKKFDDVEESESDMDSTQVLKNSLIQNLSKENLLLDEIDHKLDQASVLNPEDDQYNIDAKVDFKSKDGGSEDDIWVDNGKSIVPFDDSYLLNSDSSLLETQADENDTQNVDMQFDEITIQDDVDKKTSESKKIQCDKGYINEDLGFNFLSTGLEEIEYLIPQFEKQLENDLDVEPINNGIELVNNFTQILSPKVDISDMQIGLPSVVRNDDWQTSLESKCFYGIKLNDVDSNRNEYGIQQLATKSQEKNQPPKNVTFYERKVALQKALSKNEKKVVEFIWHACNDGSDIVLKNKDLQVQLGIFESLFPDVEVAAGIIDIWSLVLNHEKKYREKNSGGGNIYCYSGMLTAEINIIDNLDNDIEDISVRYSELPIYDMVNSQYIWIFISNNLVRHDKKENKRKRPAVDNHLDCENAVVKKKKGKKKEKDNTIRLIPLQEKSIQDMGFGDFLNGNFDFYFTPSTLGMWVVRNFDPKSCKITMEDGRRIKITRELIHGTLRIPMGDIKVESQKEKNLSDTVTAKWRKSVKKIVNKKSNTISISKLEKHLIDLSKCDWEFNLGFLVLFFSIFGLGNKDGTVNERIIPFLPNTEDVSKMDWCLYTLECMIIYVNSTVSETVKVEKTVPAFKAWNSKLLLKREQEEIELGEDVDASEDLLDKNEDFKSLDFEEMKDILRQNLVKCNKLMVDTDYKLKIALTFNPEDKEIKKMIEDRNNGHNEETEGEEIDEDESQNEPEHNESESIDNIGILSLSAGQNTSVNAPVESIINATVESTVNVVAGLPQICVQAKGNGTSDVASKKQVEVEKVNILKEKHTIKPSRNFYDRRIKISEPLFEEEKKLVEYIWSDSCPEGDIVFARKGLILECLWFLSLYPEIKVAANIIDAWTDVLNHEEKYRKNLSVASHVYCWTEMLPPYLVEDKNQVNERRRIFDENVEMILENSKKKNFNHVDLVFFPCIKDSNHHYIICFNIKNAEIDIIDNINNDVEDISERYGAYAMALIDSFINYLERCYHPGIFAIVNVNPKQVPITWKTSNNCVDSGVFVMRHMETYLGSEEFCQEDAVEKKSSLYPSRKISEGRRELFDTLMCLRDDKRLESDKLSLLNEMIAMVEEDIAN